MRPLSKNAQLAKSQRGLTLVELMVALLIALFLMGGLATLFMNMRTAFGDQNKLAGLQDNARMALTMITDVIQLGGYFPDPTTNVATIAVPTPFAGTEGATAAVPDSVAASYMTASGDTILNCSGTANATGADALYTNTFTVSGGQLICSMADPAGETQYALVSGVQNMQIQYGVRTNILATCLNCADTYKDASQMTAADWANVMSVVVILTFDNPLYAGNTAAQPQTISFRRTVSVMAKVGVVL